MCNGRYLMAIWLETHKNLGFIKEGKSSLNQLKLSYAGCHWVRIAPISYLVISATLPDPKCQINLLGALIEDIALIERKSSFCFDK
jgi:hypothetical protein